MTSVSASRNAGMGHVASTLVAMTVSVAAVVISMAAAQIGSARLHSSTTVASQPVSMSVAISPDPVGILNRATIVTAFQSSGDIPEPLRAQLEVRDGIGKPVLSMNQSGFRVPSRGTRAIYWEWRVPASVDPGGYTVAVKLVGVDSGKVYGEEPRAATLSVKGNR